ncbi:GNAT family N-acetyltransferase [Alkalicaulis satelles]|uniref:GNAT family N-acetyltransferase n=1 Tax=Alkalicaulis satelles TaxID=2609175 RepID=A0A5M6ZN36_9PROT|nr:GNAT family N-acetyltransferase [Alkalicaulis satelles]KAA5804658.1 GNAT family N-acetyltransferase [Alkalicaulis satelles]
MEIVQLRPGQAARYAAWLSLFGAAFDEADTYTGAMPSEAYRDGLLANGDFLALAALDGERVIGGLAAYVMRKFERERSEIYIYDLAVAEDWRRRGVATALINTVRKRAPEWDAWVLMIQADHQDEAPVALYSKLGQREDVLHFDILPLESEPEI